LAVVKTVTKLLGAEMAAEIVVAVAAEETGTA